MPVDSRRCHFGVLPFTGTGHLLPFLALAEELRRRGHRVTFFEKPKIRDRVCKSGFEFVPVTDDVRPPLETATAARGSGPLSEIEILRFNLRRISGDVEFYLRETPHLLRRYELDALIINEIALTGPTVAQILGLPYFLISTSVPHSFGWKGSSWLTGYRYSRSWLSWLQSIFLEVSALHVRGPFRRLLDRRRKELGFGPVREIPSKYPPLAEITQLPPCLGQPDKRLPANFFYAGPLVSASTRGHVPFPWEQLDGRPVVYASLGTTRNVQAFAFQFIAEACHDLDVQLILSLGNRFEPNEFEGLPGRSLVVRYAPQLELLKVASVVITHGGANSVFETLLEGKPMIVIPLAYDQPAMAARLAKLHIAEVLPVMRLSARRIRNAVTKVLRDRSYADAAVRMQRMISPPRGAATAVEIIEDCIGRYAPSKPSHSMPERFEHYSGALG